MRNSTLDAWIQDLRTTTAEQGTGFLETSSGAFCCLGRLCEVVDPTYDRHGRMYPPDRIWRLVSSDLPGVVPDPAEDSQPGAQMPFDRRLSDMNDDEHRTFSQIADYLDDTRLDV